MAKCILVVDDDRVNTELVKRTLQGSGYEVMTAQDGLEALDGLKTKIPDLILLDVQMPKMDGYAFIMKKTSDPALAKIPVIVLSALGKTEPMFKRHGVKAYLLKPINTQDLLDKIGSIVPA
jgi:CheY-like chemotaxis protein